MVGQGDAEQLLTQLGKRLSALPRRPEYRPVPEPGEKTDLAIELRLVAGVEGVGQMLGALELENPDGRTRLVANEGEVHVRPHRHRTGDDDLKLGDHLGAVGPESGLQPSLQPMPPLQHHLPAQDLNDRFFSSVLEPAVDLVGINGRSVELRRDRRPQAGDGTGDVGEPDIGGAVAQSLGGSRLVMAQQPTGQMRQQADGPGMIGHETPWKVQAA